MSAAARNDSFRAWYGTACYIEDYDFRFDPGLFGAYVFVVCGLGVVCIFHNNKLLPAIISD